MRIIGIEIGLDRAQYRPHEEVRLLVRVNASRASGGAEAGGAAFTVTATVTRLSAEVRRVSASVQVRDGRSSHSLSLGRYGGEGVGYGVEVRLAGATESTAFDVASHPAVTGRYGFVAHFGEGSYATDTIDWLARLHVNFVQFYDWMYRHHDLVPPTERYVDLMGKESSRAVLSAKIAACRSIGMLPIAYGAIYGAGLDFAREHPDWCLYNPDGTIIDFIGVFAIMNIAPDSPWRAHIVNEFRQAVDRLDFAGIHLDTYGYPKQAWGFLAGTRRLERLDEQIPALIDAVRARLDEPDRSPTLIFNNVSAWPLERTGNADVIYVEVWEPFTRYRHLRDLIGAGLRSGGGKPVVLAAYLPAFREAAASDDTAKGEQGAVNGLGLITAVIATFGGQHLVHGEGQAILTQGYYVDHAVLPAEAVDCVVAYQDFIVRYEELLLDRALVDVTMTHTRGDTPQYELVGCESSADAESDLVWVVVRESLDTTLVSLINLLGNDDRWATAKRRPPRTGGLRLATRDVRTPRAVYAASPDTGSAAAQPLEYSIERSGSGVHATIDLPPLDTWSIVWIEWETNARR